MDINSIRALSNDDMQAVNQLIQQQVDSEVALINQLGFTSLIAAANVCALFSLC